MILNKILHALEHTKILFKILKKLVTRERLNINIQVTGF